MGIYNTIFLLRKNEKKYVRITDDIDGDKLIICNGRDFVSFDVKDLNLLIRRLEQLREKYREEDKDV